MPSRALFSLLAVVLVALSIAPAAFADGDPASDVLLTDNVFLSYQSPYGSAEGRALEGLAKEAKKQGFPMRVAVITQLADMGSVGGLYGKAQRYADFLASEITFVYRGTLVVTMSGKPGGFGVHGPGATPAARRALARMKLPSSSLTAAELARQAAVAMQRVAAASGHHLATPSGAATKTKSSSHLLRLFLIAALALAALGAGATLLARWLRGPAPADKQS
jgi:hypothetical protein